LRAFRPRDVFHLRRIRDIDVSPEGDAVAYTLADPDPTPGGVQRRIYRLGGAAQDPEPLTRGPADRLPSFAPDGRHLAFLRSLDGSEQIHLLPLAGGEALQLTALGAGVRAYAWGPQGQQLAVLSSVGPPGRTMDQVFHFALDGTWRQLSEDAFDHQGPSFAPDGRALACLLVRRSGPPACALAVVPTDGGPWRRLSEWQEVWSEPLFAPDGASVYAIGRRLDEAPRLYRVSVEGGPPAAVADEPWPDAFADLPELRLVGDGQRLLALCRRRGVRVLAHLSLSTRRWQFASEPGRLVQAFAASIDGERVALLAGAPAEPPEVELRDESGRLLLRSDHHDLFRADVHFMPEEPLGETDGARLLLPEPLPLARGLAVLPGDTADGATGGAGSLLAQALCGHGLAVLRVPLRAADAAEDPAALAKDVLDLAQAAMSRLPEHARRVALCGSGVGGYVALRLLCVSADFRAAAVLGAATDLIGLFASGDLAAATGIPNWPAPWESPELYVERSPLLQAGDLRAPLLLVGGEEDRVAPPAQVRELAHALRCLGRIVREEVHQGLGRDLAEAPLRVQAQVMGEVAGWLVDHLAQ